MKKTSLILMALTLALSAASTASAAAPGAPVSTSAVGVCAGLDTGESCIGYWFDPIRRTECLGYHWDGGCIGIGTNGNVD